MVVRVLVRSLAVGLLVAFTTIVGLLMYGDSAEWIGWLGVSLAAVITGWVFAETAQPRDKKYPSAVRSRRGR
jgi:hypothetical protein